MNNLTDKIKDLKTETSIIEHVLAKYPDAVHQTFKNVFYQPENLNFSTNLDIIASEVTYFGTKDLNIFYVNAYDEIDKSMFNLSEDLNKKFSKIKVLTPNYIIAHEDSNHGFIIDNINYIPPQISFKDPETFQQEINGVQQGLVDWVIARTKFDSFKKLQPMIGCLPAVLHEKLQNHFILK